MDFVYLIMDCVAVATVIVATVAALWFMLELLTDSSDRHSNLYVITCTIGAVTLMLFGIELLAGGLK